MSEAKAPAAIARDIQRRFLPQYREQLARVMASWTAEQEYERGKAAARERLTALPGASTSSHAPNKIWFSGGITVEVCGPNCLSLEARSLSVEVAEAILRSMEVHP